VHKSVSIDFETTSRVDLRKTGVYEYAKHPSTRVLWLSYRFDDGTAARWTPNSGQPFPQALLDHVANMGLVSGWNVGFEYVIWNYVLTRYGINNLPLLAPGQLRDTMARAAYWGLPLSLDQAGPAAGLPPSLWKDADGHKLMMQMNKPRKVYPDGTVAWWDKDDPAKLDRLGAYCDRDVLVESEIAKVLPPLPDREQLLWQLDLRMNERGVKIDRDLVTDLRALADRAAKDINGYVQQLTNGQVKSITATAQIMAFLQVNGSTIENLRKDTVAARLKEDNISDLERELLELRQDGAKTSVAKLDAMLLASGADGRARGALQYYGAFRTGRWAGRLIQMQNMPRGSIKKIDAAIAAVKNKWPDEALNMFFGPSLAIVSSALRGCLAASPGHRVISADFSQIEARVIAWLAGQQDILDVFARNEDVYTYTANLNGSKDRQLGKVLVLACGFGMSAKKFRDTAATYGLKLTEEFCAQAVAKWRRNNHYIVDFWYDCERAARTVIEQYHAFGGHASVLTVGPLKFGMHQGNLLIGLPSGRHLVYRDAAFTANLLIGLPSGRHLVYRDAAFTANGITYMGVDQYTRQWTRITTYGGKLAENITQAVARDIMADAVIKMETVGVPVELLVHDEIIAEVPASIAESTKDRMLDIMRAAPAWAPGLPVWAEGWAGERYRK